MDSLGVTAEDNKQDVRKMSLPNIGFNPEVPRRAAGGGGMIYPGADRYVLNKLKRPKHDQDARKKLLHNNKVFSYF